MNLNTLRYIVAVADAHSFSQAAKTLYVTQSTISQAVISVENQLKVRLFDRSSIPLTLTPEGHIYISWARSMLQTEAQMRRQIGCYAESGKVRLGIGIAAHRSYLLLPELIEQMIREFPHCLFDIRNALVPDLYRALDERDLDIIVSDLPANSSQYHTIRVQDEHILLAVPKSIPITGQHSPGSPFPILSLRQVADCPFISFAPHTYLGYCLRVISEMENVVPKYQVEVSDLRTALALCARGVGVTVVPEFSVIYGSNPEELEFFSIDKYTPTRQLTISRLKSQDLSEPGKRFVDLFYQKYAKPECDDHEQPECDDHEALLRK